MRNPFINFRICLLSGALPVFWKRSPALPVLLMETASGPLVADAWAGAIKAFRRPGLSSNWGDQASKLLIQGDQQVEAIVGFSRGSGR